jgi:hypothetical protein
MGKKLQLRNVEVLCHLVHVGVQEQEIGHVVGIRRQIAASVAVPQQGNDGGARWSLDAGLQTTLESILEGMVEQRALVEQLQWIDAI